MAKSLKCLAILSAFFLTGNAPPARITHQPPRPKALTQAAGATPPGNARQYIAPCRTPHDHDQCTLEADWKAADASAAAARWALLQTILSAAGVGGLILSLLYTRKAVRAAEGATKDTERALEIAARNATAASHAASSASESNAIARQAMQIQLRPYVYLEGLFCEINHMLGMGVLADTGNITIVIKNYGQTPAKAVSFVARTEIGDFWNGRPNANLENATRIYLGDIPEGDTRQQGGYTVLGIKQAHDFILDASQSIFVEGQIQYSDAFGNEYYSNFQRAYTGIDYSSAGPAITPHWNQAT